MQLTPKIIVTRHTSPSTEPVTLSEAKLFLRVEHDTEDSAIQQMIVTAREVAEEILGRSLLSQRWLATVYGAPANTMALPYGPINSVVSVTRYDDVGGTSIAATDSYQLCDPYTLEFLSNVSVAKLEVVYEAGMATDAAGLPAALKQSMLQHVAYLYGFRSLDESQRMHDITRLYAPFREVQL